MELEELSLHGTGFEAVITGLPLSRVLPSRLATCRVIWATVGHAHTLALFSPVCKRTFAVSAPNQNRLPVQAPSLGSATTFASFDSSRSNAKYLFPWPRKVAFACGSVGSGMGISSNGWRRGSSNNKALELFDTCIGPLPPLTCALVPASTLAPWCHCALSAHSKGEQAASNAPRANE